MEFLSTRYFGNTVADYLYAAAVFGIVLAGLYLLRSFGISRLRELAKKTKTDLDDLLVDLIYAIKAPEYHLIALYAAVRYLELPPAFHKALFSVILVVLALRAVTLAQRLLDYWLEKFTSERYTDQAVRETVLKSARAVLKTLLWVTAFIFVLSNLGVNVSAALAGLGIGGVAVALAAQAILGDLFNFFVILLDKPFRIGDFVILDDMMGTVEHIGLKSTRVRSLGGELIIVSNSRMLTGGLRNYKAMQQRRVVFKLGVTYQTPLEKLRRIPELIKAAVAAVPDTRFDRSNLQAYGAYSVDFETVYYVTVADYNVYAADHEAVLLKIGEAFAAEKIEFAYPTQTLFVNKQQEV
ncbi:MAG: MscS Mechanosensitive ion channel [Elusimicrobia bacterium]|nr:MAG: MscS Mechanosensitive ion channel [Elusimicrobiota bacterium]KAF0155408.1 MAG: MscS Mechanosensitive ion channel [Elusimicrobiota bacterium]